MLDIDFSKFSSTIRVYPRITAILIDSTVTPNRFPDLRRHVIAHGRAVTSIRVQRGAGAVPKTDPQSSTEAETRGFGAAGEP